MLNTTVNMALWIIQTVFLYSDGDELSVVNCIVPIVVNQHENVDSIRFLKFYLNFKMRSQHKIFLQVPLMFKTQTEKLVKFAPQVKSIHKFQKIYFKPWGDFCG